MNDDNQRTQTYLAFCFGLIFIIAILSLVVVFPNPTRAQYEVFRIVIALAAGGVGAVIPGLLDVKMRLGLTSGQRMAIRAGGALAVFLIVYFYSPAQLTASTSVIQTGNGPCNSNIANATGNISINCGK